MNRKDKKLKIYYECLEKDYFDKSIEPLLNILYSLVICYERGIKEGKYTNLFMDNEEINELRIEFVSKLIDLFIKIVRDNKQNQVYDTCKLLIASKGSVSKIFFWLTVMFYPQEAYTGYIDGYYSTINDIISWYANNNINIKEYKAIDSDLKELLYQYKEYSNNLPDNNKQDLYNRISFINYMQVVIAHFYKEKYDINIFPRVLDYVYQNIDFLDDFYEMNKYDNKEHPMGDVEICEIIVNKIIDSCLKNNRIIK